MFGGVISVSDDLVVLIITIVIAGAHHVPQELRGLDGRAQGPEGDDRQRQRQAGVVQTGGLVDHHVDHHLGCDDNKNQFSSHC